MARVRRWAAVVGAVLILSAGWAAPAEADGETAPTASWLMAWTWDWVTWADDFTWGMVGVGVDLLPCTSFCGNSTSYAGQERFYWTTGFGPTSSPVTGYSVMINHSGFGAPSSSAPIRFTCGTDDNNPPNDRFLFHDVWLHFVPPTETAGHYVEMLAGYACGPGSGNTYERYMQAQWHWWSRDANGHLVTDDELLPAVVMPDSSDHRYIMDRQPDLDRWRFRFPGATSLLDFNGDPPVGRGMEWGVESSFSGGNLSHAHVPIWDTRHQYGEGTGYFPHSQNGFHSTQEAPWGGHIAVYRNAQGQAFYNGVHVCTYSSTCGG